MFEENFDENGPEEKGNGYVLLHRAIKKHWIWDDANKLKWWLDLITEVNHSDHKTTFGFEVIECKRGQSLKSLQTWAKRWAVDVSTVRRFFKLLEKDDMVKLENLKKTTRLTICKYESYNDGRNAKQFRRNSHAIQKQFGDNSDATLTKNESKNDIKNEEIKEELPHGESFLKIWVEWKKFRKEIKKPLTETTIKKQLELLAAETENDAVEIITKSIQNQWQGLFPLKKDNNGSKTNRGNTNSGNVEGNGGY